MSSFDKYIERLVDGEENSFDFPKNESSWEELFDFGRRRISEIVSLESKIKKATKVALGYGQIDGGHHKMWVIDQMLRALTGDNYNKIIEQACAPEEGDEDQEVYEWDCGIAP